LSSCAARGKQLPHEVRLEVVCEQDLLTACGPACSRTAWWPWRCSRAMGLTPQATASALPRPRTLQRAPVRKVHQRVSPRPQVCISAQLIGCCRAAAAPGHTEERRGLLTALPPPSTSGAAQLFAGVPAPKQRAKLPVSFRLPTRAPIDSDDEVRPLQGTGSVTAALGPLSPCNDASAAGGPPEEEAAAVLQGRAAHRLPARARQRRCARARLRQGAQPRPCQPCSLPPPCSLPVLTRPLTRPRGPAARGRRQRRGVQGRGCAAAAGAVGRHGRRVRPCGGRRGGRGRGRPAGCGGRQRGLQGGPRRRSRSVCRAAACAGRRAARRCGAGAGAALAGARRWRVPCRGPQVRPTAHLQAWGAQHAGRPCRAAPGAAGGRHAHAGQAAQCLLQSRARTLPGAGD